MKKVYLMMCICLMFCLTGCGAQFPELTDEEYEQIVQFSSAVVMKHSNNGVEKLATVTPRRIRELDENPYAPVDTAVSAEASSDATITDKSSSDTGSSKKEEKAAEQTKPEQKTEKPAKSEEKQETDISDTGSSESDAEQDVSGGSEGEDVTTPASDDDDTEAEGERIRQGEQQDLNGLTISYTGYSVTSAYPDDSYAYAVDASPGKKLLILGFRISNLTGSDKELDMIKNNPHFQIIVNGENQGYTLVTVLDNDLSSYKGVIPADSKETMILAIQVDSTTAKSIETLSMKVSMNGNEQTIILEE